MSDQEGNAVDPSVDLKFDPEAEAKAKAKASPPADVSCDECDHGPCWYVDRVIEIQQERINRLYRREVNSGLLHSRELTEALHTMTALSHSKLDLMNKAFGRPKGIIIGEEQDETFATRMDEIVDGICDISRYLEQLIEVIDKK